MKNAGSITSDIAISLRNRPYPFHHMRTFNLDTHLLMYVPFTNTLDSCRSTAEFDLLVIFIPNHSLIASGNNALEYTPTFDRTGLISQF